MNWWNAIGVGLQVIHALEDVAAGRPGTVPFRYKDVQYLLTVQRVPATARLTFTTQAAL